MLLTSSQTPPASDTIGADLIDGLDGNDIIYGGAGADVLVGGLGNDTLRGEAGDDQLDGGEGNDYLTGGNGSDVMNGGAGDDIFYGATEANAIDAMNGGEGNDIFYSVGYLSDDIVNAGAGDDLVRLSLGGNSSYQAQPIITLGSGADMLDLYGSNISAYASAIVTDFDVAVDTVNINYLVNNKLTGWDGSSNPFGSGFMQLVQDGADTLLQVDVNGGGDGYVTVVTFQNTTATAFSELNFIVNASTGQGYAPDGSGISGQVLSGTSGNDSLIGTIGDDTISGLAGDDAIDGGNGNDLLVGGNGIDTLNGRFGADTFIFKPGDGNDAITDFELGYDGLDLQGGLMIASLTEIDTNADTMLDATLVTLSDGGTLLLEDLLGVVLGSDLLI